MTETAMPEPPPAAARRTDLQLQPADVLMHLVVTLLTPFFLAATNGNIGLARLAAFETVNAFRLENHVDLLAVAQIVGAGLASLRALSRSMDDDLPLTQILLLHDDAAALDRVSQHNRRALRNGLAEPASSRARGNPSAADAAADPVADARYEAAVVAELARTKLRVAEARSGLPNPSSPQHPAHVAEPDPIPSPPQTQTQTTTATPTPNAASAMPVASPTAQPTPPTSATPPASAKPPTSATPAASVTPATSVTPAASATPAPSPTEHPATTGVPAITDRERQALWAAAMTEVAGEYTASARFLPAAERKQASQRAAALSSTANTLLCASIPSAARPAAVNPPSRHAANPKRR